MLVSPKGHRRKQEFLSMKSLKNNRLAPSAFLLYAWITWVVGTPSTVSATESDPSDPAAFQAQDGVLWGFVLGQAALYAFDVWDLMPIGAPLVGPGFDPAQPDPALLLSAPLDAAIGHPHVKETVPTSAIVYTAVGTLAGLNGLVALSPARTDWRPYHQVSLGLSTAVFTTISLTEVLKRTVGRLRPDFRERFVARGCQGELNVEMSELPCEDVNPLLQNITQEEYDYGRRSFPSGHSSTAFALGTFTALFLYQTGQDNFQTNPMLAYASWGGAMSALGLASAVAGSRITDNRHHLEDVLTGSIIGAAIASASYFFVTAPIFSNPSTVAMRIQPMLSSNGGLSIGGEW